ncbi:unnamed protein product [Paramecium primaurelia]|uniref:Uncharacterized protein n=1 Tax=Paramecium primaurelia TaxID=5886 RepID=A0A8S1MBX5_PARPR|nr:unnamed protein product [Paramecium primaurelia]
MFKCSLRINKYVVNCIGSEYLFCSLEIYLNQEGTTQDESLLLPQYFSFDNLEIYVCQNCIQTNLESIYVKVIDFSLQSFSLGFQNFQVISLIQKKSHKGFFLLMIFTNEILV